MTPQIASKNSGSSAMPIGVAREALRLAVRQLDMAELRQRPEEMTRTLAQVGRCYSVLGAWAPAESYLQQALRWARMLGARDMSVELLCDLAEAACAGGIDADAQEDRGAHYSARERARDLAFEAAAQARHATDPSWEFRILSRVSDVLDRCNDHDDAVALRTRALSLKCSSQTAAEGQHQATRPASMQ